ncbi:hypothetical protein [Endozoicomonas euniceicola]|uniref:Uncharacterized protein n=1 Tax=Endozoicomonas euniceicola TaxID=1234143 RepID=A0ABY6GP09_9GAMM|nr:hypothetical protein [Endozoicomonas euniceicola]UYM13843.1 hypothetical protein NX720_13010 [Endozoicomonas euniceicola]
MQNNYLYEALVNAGTDAELAKQAASCDHCLQDIREHLYQVHIQAASMNNEILLLRRDVEERFKKVDERFEKIEERFEKVEERFEKVDERFEKVDERFEKVDERFDRLEGRFDRLEGRFDKLESMVQQLLDR